MDERLNYHSSGKPLINIFKAYVAFMFNEPVYLTFALDWEMMNSSTTFSFVIVLTLL